MWHRLLFPLFLSLSSLAHAQDGAASDTFPPPRAEDLRDLLSARSYGMGGAWRALGVGAESGTGNPAALASFRSYRVELSGGWDWVGQDAFGMVAVADSVTSAMAAGVAYQLVTLGKGPERTTAHVNTVSMALPFSDAFLLGVSTRHLLLQGARQANAVTGDAGLLFRPSQAFALGVSAHNLIGTGHAELTRYYSAHGAFLAGIVNVAADVRADFETDNRTTFTYSGGLEVILGQHFPLRAGYTWDGFTRSSQIGAGIGLMTAGGGLDLAYRHDLGGEGGRLVALTFKLQVH